MDQLTILQKMNQTGIGFAGIDGVWWQPAAAPFPLPVHTRQMLNQISQAVFLLLDTVTAQMQAGLPELVDLLTYKVPPSLPRLMGQGAVYSLRPDFQLCPTPDGLFPVITELEIAPSAHGFTHAMQVGYGLEPDLVQTLARFLNGRSFIFAGTHQWSAFLFEQLAFCRALAEAGATGWVLYDKTVAHIADEVQAGQRWQLPMFGIAEKPDRWDTDVLARLGRHGLQDFWWPEPDSWPAEVGQAAVFRFGYFDTFSLAQLQQFVQWQQRGATLLNPVQYILDSKVVLAALNLPRVRQLIAAQDSVLLDTLDRCIPQTVLLTPTSAPALRQNKDAWVVKFAGYDGSNQSWGGVSLQVGLMHTRSSWAEIIDRCLALPWPVVAQHVTPSLTQGVNYITREGKIAQLLDARTRLRVFLVRDLPPGGAHVTFSANTMQVSESVTAVQAPVQWQS